MPATREGLRDERECISEQLSEWRRCKLLYSSVAAMSRGINPSHSTLETVVPMDCWPPQGACRTAHACAATKCLPPIYHLFSSLLSYFSLVRMCCSQSLGDNCIRTLTIDGCDNNNQGQECNPVRDVRESKEWISNHQKQLVTMSARMKVIFSTEIFHS